METARGVPHHIVHDNVGFDFIKISGFQQNCSVYTAAKRDCAKNLFHHLKLKHLVEYEESQKMCVKRQTSDKLNWRILAEPNY